jgi:hypothetical protein
MRIMRPISEIFPERKGDHAAEMFDKVIQITARLALRLLF